MSVSSLHKEVLNQKTVNRGDAFKVMSSLNLIEISQILYSTYKKMSSDQSAYVRRIALISLQKIYQMDDQPQLKQILDQSMKDTPYCKGLAIILYVQL